MAFMSVETTVSLAQLQQVDGSSYCMVSERMYGCGILSPFVVW